MPIKSYVPQCVRLINRVCAYITKHQGTMNPYLSSAQQSALQSVVSACQAFQSVITRETP